MVFARYPLSMQHKCVRIKIGWLGIKIMCPSGATYLPVNCCFRNICHCFCVYRYLLKSRLLNKIQMFIITLWILSLQKREHFDWLNNSTKCIYNIMQFFIFISEILTTRLGVLDSSLVFEIYHQSVGLTQSRHHLVVQM